MTSKTSNTGIAVCTLAFVLSAVVGVSLSAWNRTHNRAFRVSNTDAAIERVASDFRIVNIGNKSVLIDAEDGGTGNRVMIEVWALQVRGVNNVWADLVWSHGLTDDVVPYLQTLQREHEARADSMLFNRRDYVPHRAFEPF